MTTIVFVRPGIINWNYWTSRASKFHVYHYISSQHLRTPERYIRLSLRYTFRHFYFSTAIERVFLFGTSGISEVSLHEEYLIYCCLQNFLKYTAVYSIFQGKLSSMVILLFERSNSSFKYKFSNPNVSGGFLKNANRRSPV